MEEKRKTKIKICGLRRREDVLLINRMKPDYAGFILAPGRRRTITEEQLMELRSLLSPEIRAVGVFVNDSPERIARLANAGMIDVVQLHGQENEQEIRALRRILDPSVTLIKAFSVKEEGSLAEALRSSADLILLDQGIGGTGRTFDWALLDRMTERPYLLAGGLNPENAGDAVRLLHPFGVDVSSGAERDGVKDEEQIRRLMRAVAEAENHGDAG